MKKTLLMLLLLLAAISGCVPDPAKTVPNGIIPREKMKDVYIDVFFIEAATQELRLPVDSSKKLMQQRYEQIALKHHITTAELFSSMQYYSTHPEIYGETLQTVIDSLSAMQARAK